MAAVEAFTREIGINQTDNVAGAGPYGADVVVKVTVAGMFIGGDGLGAQDSNTQANGYEIKANVEYRFRLLPQPDGGNTLYIRNASGAVAHYSTYLTRLTV